MGCYAANLCTIYHPRTGRLRLLLVTDSRYRRYTLCDNFFRTVTVVATRCMEVYWCLGEHPWRRLGLYKDENLAHELFCPG